MRWIVDRYGLGPADVVLLKTPATFDVSVWELFGAVHAGARMVIAAPEGHRDPAYLAEVLAAPAGDDHVVRAVDAGGVRRVRPTRRRWGRCGRCWLPVRRSAPDALAVRAVMPRVALHNLYGPTEFAVHATSHEVVDADAVAAPIGSPVWNSRAFVLDARAAPGAAGGGG